MMSDAQQPRWGHVELMRNARLTTGCLILTVALAGCDAGAAEMETDAGCQDCGSDAGGGAIDGGPATSDAGAGPERDAGPSPVSDGGADSIDAGADGTDAGASPSLDAGRMDAGPPDGGGADASAPDAGPPGPPVTLCANDCAFDGDGACDDGGPGSTGAFCPLGSDCADCGPRECVPSCPVDACGAPDGCGGVCPRAPSCDVCAGGCEDSGGSVNTVDGVPLRGTVNWRQFGMCVELEMPRAGAAPGEACEGVFDCAEQRCGCCSETYYARACIDRECVSAAEACPLAARASGRFTNTLCD